MLACRLFGHRWRFWAEGRTMKWACQRCGVENRKQYASEADARRYARAFDREDSEDLGKRAPFFALFPLRLARRARRR
jgi:hypothetical protein